MPTTQARTETTPATSPALGFTSQEEELAGRELALAGELPEWLGGTLVRVTPALLDPGGKPLRHWFDGLAMLNAFTIADGGVSYASRFLESRDYRHVREHGEIRGRTFGSDPCRTIFQRVSSLFSPGMTDNCNVNVTRLGERWIAMTETPIAIEFDPETLDTVGPLQWAGKQDQGTAHPHYDFERREAVSYSVRFGPRSSYRLHATPDGDREPHEVAKRAGARAGVHALVRAHRPLRDPVRPAARGQPAQAGVRQALVHRELRVEARARHALPGDRPRDR